VYGQLADVAPPFVCHHSFGDASTLVIILNTYSREFLVIDFLGL